MRKTKLFLALTMVATMAAAGCGGKTDTVEKPEEAVQTTESSAEDTKEESSEPAESYTVTDAFGREVKFDKVPEKVIANGSSLRLYAYVGDMDKVIASEEIEHNQPEGRPYRVANPRLGDLPVIGKGGSKDSDNLEEIISAKPDVLFLMGQDKEGLDKYQDKIGLPVVGLTYGKDSVFDPDMYNSLQVIGKVMKTEDRANEVVNYMKDLKEDLEKRTADIPENERPRVYLGAVGFRGPHGIDSTRGDYTIFKALNVHNVADDEGIKGVTMVEKEKIIDWDPDIILLDTDGLRLVKEDFDKEPVFYQSLKAFKDEKVYTVLPYNFYASNIEMAMSDAYYIGKVVYPDRFKDVDPIAKADEIYEYMVGEKMYDKLAAYFYGGFGQLTLDNLKNLNVEGQK